jgi:SagB-type dehydrogenase family enzyme
MEEKSPALYIFGSAVCVMIIGLTAGYYAAYRDIPRNVQYVVTEDQSTVKEVAAPEGYAVRKFDHLTVIALPAPDKIGVQPFEATVANRRSRYQYDDTPLSLIDLGQMLWAGQGITNDEGGRTAPSARSMYPIRLFVAVKNVADLEPGIYEYLPASHSIGLVARTDAPIDWDAVTPQAHPVGAAAVIMVAANMSNPAVSQLVLQESGHVGQNLYLQAETIDGAMLVMGGFTPEVARELIGIDEFERVVYLVPFGYRITE